MLFNSSTSSRVSWTARRERAADVLYPTWLGHLAISPAAVTGPRVLDNIAQDVITIHATPRIPNLEQQVMDGPQDGHRQCMPCVPAYKNSIQEPRAAGAHHQLTGPLFIVFWALVCSHCWIGQGTVDPPFSFARCFETRLSNDRSGRPEEAYSETWRLRFTLPELSGATAGTMALTPRSFSSTMSRLEGSNFRDKIRTQCMATTSRFGSLLLFRGSPKCSQTRGCLSTYCILWYYAHRTRSARLGSCILTTYRLVHHMSFEGSGLSWPQRVRVLSPFRSIGSSGVFRPACLQTGPDEPCRPSLKVCYCQEESYKLLLGSLATGSGSGLGS